MRSLQFSRSAFWEGHQLSLTEADREPAHANFASRPILLENSRAAAVDSFAGVRQTLPSSRSSVLDRSMSSYSAERHGPLRSRSSSTK